MAKREFSWSSILIRFIAALVLVFATYHPGGYSSSNPEAYSYFHWAIQPLVSDISSFSIEKTFVGVVLIIAWVVFIRATLRSLGPIGISLAFAFFGTLVWLIVDWGIVPADSVRALTYLAEVVLCGVLAIGISWSHVRRRLTGQRDVDDVEDD